jgi:magnesium and cobalt transporter
MSDQSPGSTGRWLKRITQSMSGEPRDLAELIEDLREASIRGLFDGDALVMLEGVLAVADMQVRDIMVPRSQMVFVERDEPPDKLVALVVESGHSRFPVIGEDRDQILGILLAKDLLRLQRPAQGVSVESQPHRHGGGRVRRCLRSRDHRRCHRADRRGNRR